MTTAARLAPPAPSNVLRSIAVYKLLKVLLLLVIAYGELRLSAFAFGVDIDRLATRVDEAIHHGCGGCWAMPCHHRYFAIG